MIIAITGKKGAGKDELSRFFVADGFEQHRFADPLKAMLETFLRMQGVPTLTIQRMLESDLKEAPAYEFNGRTPRHVMQTLGTDWRDMVHKDLWSDALTNRIKDLSGNVIVSDCRFEHELAWLKAREGVLIKVDRFTEGRTDEGKGHVSETEMEALKADVEVFNYGSLEDFQQIAPIVVSLVKNLDEQR